MNAQSLPGAQPTLSVNSHPFGFQTEQQYLHFRNGSFDRLQMKMGKHQSSLPPLPPKPSLHHSTCSDFVQQVQNKEFELEQVSSPMSPHGTYQSTEKGTKSPNVRSLVKRFPDPECDIMQHDIPQLEDEMRDVFWTSINDLTKFEEQAISKVCDFILKVGDADRDSLNRDGNHAYISILKDRTESAHLIKQNIDQHMSERSCSLSQISGKIKGASANDDVYSMKWEAHHAVLDIYTSVAFSYLAS